MIIQRQQYLTLKMFKMCYPLLTRPASASLFEAKAFSFLLHQHISTVQYPLISDALLTFNVKSNCILIDVQQTYRCCASFCARELCTSNALPRTAQDANIHQPNVLLCYQCRSKIDRIFLHRSLASSAFLKLRHCCHLLQRRQCQTQSTKPTKDSDELPPGRLNTEDKSCKTKRSVRDIINQLQKDMILTVPNLLTLCRMLMAPVLGYMVLMEAYTAACGVFVVAGFTDLLDGFIARNFENQTSELGSFIDPLADKLLVSILFLSLTAVNLIPLALTTLVVVRDICLMSGGFYVRYISLDEPRTLKRYFDLTNRTAQLKPTVVSKLNTAVQLSLVAFTLGAPVFGYVDHPALQALWYLTATTTVVSGVGYIFAKGTFKLLQDSRSKKKKVPTATLR